MSILHVDPLEVEVGYGLIPLALVILGMSVLRQLAAIVWLKRLHPEVRFRPKLADRETTRKSFLHAAWISAICIILFGCLGVFAGAHALSGEVIQGGVEQGPGGAHPPARARRGCAGRGPSAPSP